MALATGGDRRALEQLLAALRPPIDRWLRRRIANGDSVLSTWVEDIAAEAIARAAERLHTCHAADDRTLIAWVLVITRRVALDYTRAGWYRVEVAASRRAAALDDLTDMASELASLREPSFDLVAAELVVLRALMAAHDALPDSAAELLWRRLVGGESWAEIGQALSTTAGGARRRFDRIRDRLVRGVLARVSALPPERQAAVVAVLQERRPSR